MGKLKIAYWDIRGLAEPIRYALEQSGEDYEEKLYYMGPAPTFDRGEWPNDKFSLGLDFPNLPYLIDGDIRITESMAVLKYVCRKHGMMPKSDRDMARADNVEGVLLGFRGSFYGLFFTPEDKYEEAKRKFRENSFPEMMDKFLNFMGERKWLVCDDLTYPDFLFYTLLKQITCLNADCLCPYPRLQKYVADFEALPAIQKYLSSGKLKRFPILNPVARWGYKEE